MPSATHAIADEKYVSLITFRKDGTPVASPVWIVRLADGTAGFTTEDGSGKVKRIRNNPKVTLQACSVRGAVKEGSPVVEATAEVLLGDAAAPVGDAIGRKYTVMMKVFKVGELWRKIRRKPEPVRCAIRLTISE
ncbi:MAG: PPOX class F420-dependent oxidoreductase [Ilumatobacteraceae bacterium]